MHQRTLQDLHKEYTELDINKIWFISDTHFYHRNVIKYCNRPFINAEEMNEVIIKNWNSVVKEDDIVWHLGDFALGDKELFARLVERLNGNIYLVYGNHDRTNTSFSKEVGFTKFFKGPIILDDKFVLTHKPLKDKLLEEAIQNNIKNIFGHIHNSDEFDTWNENYACMCVEKHNYTPVSYTKILEYFNVN